MNSLRTDILQRAHHIGWMIQIPVGASGTELKKWIQQVEEQEKYCEERDLLLIQAQKYGIQVSKPQVPISNRWIKRLSEKIENQQYYEIPTPGFANLYLENVYVIFRHFQAQKRGFRQFPEMESDES